MITTDILIDQQDEFNQLYDNLEQGNREFIRSIADTINTLEQENLAIKSEIAEAATEVNKLVDFLGLKEGNAPNFALVAMKVMNGKFDFKTLVEALKNLSKYAEA